MSAYSDYRCGAISYEEMRELTAEEARRDAYFTELEYEERDCGHCIHYHGKAGCECWECEYEEKSE